MAEVAGTRRIKFQSLIGFKINWNGSIDVDAVWCGLFQSLIGFKINWNYWFFPDSSLPVQRFNP